MAVRDGNDASAERIRAATGVTPAGQDACTARLGAHRTAHSGAGGLTLAGEIDLATRRWCATRSPSACATANSVSTCRLCGKTGCDEEGVEAAGGAGGDGVEVENLVHPHTDDKDLARRLQHRLLADHHASLGAMSVEQADSAVCHAFLSWGRQDVRLVRPSDPQLLRSSEPVTLRALVLLPGLGRIQSPTRTDSPAKTASRGQADEHRLCDVWRGRSVPGASPIREPAAKSEW
ncbi:hypothetical protein [Streptomyces rishiriensis]|uniref:hypothetical protein n=1 Tax=Streptomyces rishiriensis TaxID=68264 RepID=UPI0015844052|nr:hypothetical protein [Streptomyces rishiriensis]